MATKTQQEPDFHHLRPGMKLWCTGSDKPCEFVTVLKVNKRTVQVRLPRFGYGNCPTVAPALLHTNRCPNCPKEV